LKYIIYDVSTHIVTSRGDLPPSLFNPLEANPPEGKAVEATDKDIPVGARIDPQTLVVLEQSTFQPSKALLLSSLADIRYTHEIAGVTIDGFVIPTDRESQKTYMGVAVIILFSVLAKLPGLFNPLAPAINFATLIPTIQATVAALEFSWKLPDGFHDINALQSIGCGMIVLNYVQGCRTLERVTAAKIASGEITTRDQLYAIQWPQSVFPAGILTGLK